MRSSTSVKNWQHSIGKADSNVLFNEYQTLLSVASVQYAKDVADFGPKDALIVVDMQNDFVPKDDVNPDGGAFGVAEGSSAASVIVDLIKRCTAKGSFIVATRDYHPEDHCSFAGPNKGPFPPHCIQGSKGAEFYSPIEAALRLAREKQPELVEVVFKGFHPTADSFGSITYGDKYFEERGLGHAMKTKHDAQTHGCSAVNWTGSFCLKCSNIKETLNAPPDVLAVYGRKSLADRLKEKGIERIFAVGLALDFCVLDTALNGAGVNVAKETFLVIDASRAAHIPNVGLFGTGFLSDPKDIVNKTSAQGVKLLLTKDIANSS